VHGWCTCCGTKMMFGMVQVDGFLYALVHGRDTYLVMVYT
jgi:hypothetical protein